MKNEEVLLLWDATHYGLESFCRVLNSLCLQEKKDISTVFILSCEYMMKEDSLKDKFGMSANDRKKLLEKREIQNRINFNELENFKKHLTLTLSETDEKEFENKDNTYKKTQFEFFLFNYFKKSDFNIEFIEIPEIYIPEGSADDLDGIENAITEIVIPRIAELNPKYLHISMNSGTREMASVWISLYSTSVFAHSFGKNVSLWSYSDDASKRNIRFRKIYEKHPKQNKFIAAIEENNFFSDDFSIDLDIDDIIKKNATSNEPMLILGERGTGKSSLIKKIAKIKQERGFITKKLAKNELPYCMVTCSTLSGTLIESMLFGYEANSFTGAGDKPKDGILHEANGKILFLDEIQDLSFEVQRKLLRVLVDGHFSRYGSSIENLESHFQLICASNLELRELRKRLYPDFYDRIETFRGKLTPLRELKNTNIIEEIWKNLWKEKHLKNQHFPEKVDDFSLVKETLFSTQIKGNLRDLRQLIAYISRDVYEESNSPITENEKKSRYQKMLQSWKSDYNEKYSDEQPDFSKEFLEKSGWEGMTKLFKQWLAEYATGLYGNKESAATALGTTERTIRNAKD